MWWRSPHPTPDMLENSTGLKCTPTNPAFCMRSSCARPCAMPRSPSARPMPLSRSRAQLHFVTPDPREGTHPGTKPTHPPTGSPNGLGGSVVRVRLQRGNEVAVVEGVVDGLHHKCPRHPRLPQHGRHRVERRGGLELWSGVGGDYSMRRAQKRIKQNWERRARRNGTDQMNPQRIGFSSTSSGETLKGGAKH